MISIYSKLEEGLGKQIAAGASGLGGAVTGGHVVGGIQAAQHSNAKAYTAASKGNTKESLKHSQKGIGRSIKGAAKGSIPVTGAVSNFRQQRKLDKYREKHYNSKK